MSPCTAWHRLLFAGVKRARAALFAGSAALTLATAGATASPGLWPFDPVAVDRFMTTQMARHRIPGLALAITFGDQLVHVRGYGEAKEGVPVTGQTQFRVASLSKSFTALAVLQLVEAGKAELDAPVARWLPGFALATSSAAARISVRQLLNLVELAAAAPMDCAHCQFPALAGLGISSMPS